MRNKEIMETLLMIEKLRSLGFSVSAPAPRTMPELRQGSYKRSPAQRKRMAAAKRKWWRERKKQA